MTRKQKRVIARARKKRPRIVVTEPPKPIRRHTAGENTFAFLAQERLRTHKPCPALLREQRRIIKTWGQP